MTLGINTTTPEGIVLAADSRQSYRNQKGMSRIGSDSASKVFRLGRKIGAVVAGLAFLPEDGVIKNISRFIEDFRKEAEIEKLSVREVSEKLKEFFESKYDYKGQLDTAEKKVKAELERQGCTIVSVDKKGRFITIAYQDPQGSSQEVVAGIDQLQFIVAGYNQDESHQVCGVSVPGEVGVKRDSTQKGKEYGASWIGQTDVVQRIVLGWDGRIRNLPAMKKAFSEAGEEEANKQLRQLEYVIQWGTMTLQDAIDFSTLAIETTTAIQRFSDGIAGDPGDMPGVGGPVDVAVITPDKGFIWVSKKRLRVGNKEVDLDKIKDSDS